MLSEKEKRCIDKIIHASGMAANLLEDADANLWLNLRVCGSARQETDS